MEEDKEKEKLEEEDEKLEEEDKEEERRTKHLKGWRRRTKLKGLMRSRRINRKR